MNPGVIVLLITSVICLVLYFKDKMDRGFYMQTQLSILGLGMYFLKMADVGSVVIIFILGIIYSQNQGLRKTTTEEN